jgi:hypothetical protein
MFLYWTLLRELIMQDRKYVRYICNKCNYKFSMKRDSPVMVRCQYCGCAQVSEDDFDLDRMISSR